MTDGESVYTIFNLNRSDKAIANQAIRVRKTLMFITTRHWCGTKRLSLKEAASDPLDPRA